MNKYITTDSVKNENDKYTFYFYLPLYITKNYAEYKYLLFRPQSVGDNVEISGKWFIDVSKNVPKYGELKVENIKNGLFYLNIEDFKKGNKIHLQFISHIDWSYLEISYLFSDENYNEILHKVNHSKNLDHKKTKDGKTTYYVSQLTNELQEVTIKHIKKMNVQIQL